ncbi:MAG: S8/S53 family peptidase [Candidatus Dormibacteraeota bacterium]|nr:S8/S53 family peptidase [Candidatus Dormibacteraeota bacterium]
MEGTVKRAAPLVAAVAALLLAACGSASAQVATHARSGTPTVVSLPAHPLLSLAIRNGRDLGPLAAGTPVHLTLGLTGRDPAGLDTLLSSGQHISAQQLASQFGPDAAAVAAVRATLAAAGIASHWTAGDTTMSAQGPAGAVDALFGVRIDNRVGQDGVHFYAPASMPAIPAALQSIVNAVSGLDDYPTAGAAAGGGRSPTSVTAKQMADFYNVTPLRNNGIDGTGMTVVFPEIDQFDESMLDDFASKFNLPAFNVQLGSSSAGRPGKEQGEADLDLEIVHAIAPGAKEVVYYASADTVPQAEQQMYRDFPHGAIESSSLGECEAPGGQNKSDATLLGDMQKPAAAAGWSIFVATGDRGAYDCADQGDFNDVQADLDASLPYVTAVGGTLVRLSSSGGYGSEAAWGEPIEQWGGSGGVSEYWSQPSYQQGPGVQNRFSNGQRETPDISANADAQSGWDVFAQGSEAVVGGTSAATPFWAACAALIDQDLKKQGLPLIGFANPALYTFGQSPSGLPQFPYHDVTQGTNLYYPAVSGYDLATGLGSADINALASDFVWYERNHGSG